MPAQWRARPRSSLKGAGLGILEHTVDLFDPVANRLRDWVSIRDECPESFTRVFAPE